MTDPALRSAAFSSPGTSMSRSRYRCLSLMLAVSVAVASFWLAGQAVADDASTGPTARGLDVAPIHYSRDIRPILSQNCFLCHGQDESRRGGGLRLDAPELAVIITPARTVPGVIEECAAR